jgi:hypothetical protein
MSLSKDQIMLLNDWYNYFKDLEEQGGGSPPSYNSDDIDYWHKWYKAINQGAKKSIATPKMSDQQSAIPFDNIQQPTAKKKRTVPQSPLTTGMNYGQYQEQQGENEYAE